MEEKVIIEFTKEEVNEVRELQQNVLTITSRICETELNIHELESTFQELKTEKANLISGYNDVRAQEVELGNRLREKYGDGTYDINTNQFTPNK